tara:strand:- start:176 stop:301 length:126 start_codon:yes stop_codon:yes gene_type:complete
MTFEEFKKVLKIMSATLFVNNWLPEITKGTKVQAMKMEQSQ